MDERPSTALPPTTPPSPLSTLTTCLEETKAWMTHNFLQLNSSKTRSHTCLHPTPDQVNLHNQHNVIRAGHSLSTSFTNLGVIFDPHLWGSHQTPLQKLLPSPQKYCQTPALSLPSWCRETHPRLCLHQITAMHYSLEPLARESKGSSMCRTVLLGSWWECASMNTSHPSSIHFTVFPSPPGLTTRSPPSLTSASMAMPPPISKTC